MSAPDIDRRLMDSFAALTGQTDKWIAKTLKTTAHRGTLWLADGRGKLARWSTESARFGNIRSLKRVPTGHDSPWIAGEAIGSEEVKLKDVARDARVTPAWRSVLAVPIFVGDRDLPDFASAVLTFGLSDDAATLFAGQTAWTGVIEELSEAWGDRLSDIAFSEQDRYHRKTSRRP